MPKPFCSETCGMYATPDDDGGECGRCYNSENVMYSTALRAIAFGEEVLVIGEGKEGYRLQDGGWVSESAVEFI